MIPISYKTTILIVVSAACFCSSFFSPSIPFVASYFNISHEETSSLISIFLFGYLAGQIVHSIFFQKFGPKSALIIGFSILLISAALQIISINKHLYSLFYCGRFLCAFGASSGLICAFAIIKDLNLNEDDNLKFIALAFSSLTLFAHLSITVSGLIIQYFDWIWIFYVIFVLSIIEFLLIYFFIPSCRQQDKNYYPLRGITTNIFHAFFNIRLIISSFAVAFTTTSTYLYNAFAASLALSFFKISPACFGYISVFNLFSLLLGGWLVTRLSKKINQSNILIYGFLVALIPIGLMFTFHNEFFSEDSGGIFFFSASVLLNMALGMIYPTASSMALNSTTTGATSSSVMNFIKIAVPTLTIFLASKTHLGLVLVYQYSLGTIFLLAFICCITIKIKDSPKTS